VVFRNLTLDEVDEFWESPGGGTWFGNMDIVRPRPSDMDAIEDKPEVVLGRDAPAPAATVVINKYTTANVLLKHCKLDYDSYLCTTDIKSNVRFYV